MPRFLPPLAQTLAWGHQLNIAVNANAVQILLLPPPPFRPDRLWSNPCPSQQREWLEIIFKTYSAELVHKFSLDKCLFHYHYCSTCRSAKSQGLLAFPKHYKSAFVDDGFKNLKKALERCRDHEGSVMHKEAALKLAAIKSAANGIDAQKCSA